MRGDISDTLSQVELRTIHAYWRAANYLSVGQLYLYDIPLLREPLTRHTRRLLFPGCHGVG